MGKENDSLSIRDKVDSDLESILNKKSPRLSKGLRKHIRILKAQGDVEGADAFRAAALKKKGPLKKEQQARVMLHETIDEIINSEAPKELLEKQVRAIWLLNASGIITNEERLEELIDIIDRTDNQHIHPDIDSVFRSTRDELEDFIPKAR